MSTINISNQEDLIKYLKIPEPQSYEDAEIIVKNIDVSMDLNESTFIVKSFTASHKQIAIPQQLFFDQYGNAYYKIGDDVYKRINFNGQHSYWSMSDFLVPLVEANIPNSIYLDSQSFYISDDNKLKWAYVPTVEVSALTNSIFYKSDHFDGLSQGEKFIVDYTNEDGDDLGFFSQFFQSGIEWVTDKYERIIKVNHADDISTEIWADRFPLLIKSTEFGYKYKLLYKKESEEKDPANYTEDDEGKYVVEIHFTSFKTVIQFLKKTIFYLFNEESDFENHEKRTPFYKSLVKEIQTLATEGDFDERMELFFFLPPLLFKELSMNLLWETFTTILESSIHNFGRNDEDITINLLKGIHALHVDSFEPLEGVEVTTQPHNKFLTDLVDHKVEDEAALLILIESIDGDQFKLLMDFLWDVWKQSSFSQIDPSKNTVLEITDKSPVLLNYHSDKKFGFYTDNADIDWSETSGKIEVTTEQETDEYEIITRHDEFGIAYPEYRKVIHKLDFEYHPLSPISIFAADNPEFILKDDDNPNANFIHMPAFILHAHNESAFWKNAITAGEYALDIVTTFSGVGNILKVGRLVRLLKTAENLTFKAKLIKQAAIAGQAAVGTVEITSGTVNALLRLTGANDTPFGRSLTKYLFYLELITLSGEITAGLRKLLKKSAEGALKHTDEVSKIVKEAEETIAKNTDEAGKLSKTDEVNEAEEVLELIEQLDTITGKRTKFDLNLDKLYQKGYYYRKVGMPSGKIIQKLFTTHGNRIVKSVEKQVKHYVKVKKLSKTELSNRVLVAGIGSIKHTKKVVMHTNFPKGKLKKYIAKNNISRSEATLDDIKKIYKHLLKEGHIKNDLHPLLEKRIIRHFEELKKGIKHFNYNIERTGGFPGIHAEVLSVNEMLWIIQNKGIHLTDDIFKDMIGFNKNLIHDDVMIRCLDCNFLTYDIPFIETILKKK